MWKPPTAPQPTHRRSLFWLVGILAIILVSAIPLVVTKLSEMDNKNSTAGVVNITGDVVPCDITFIVYPEKRIPATGNWSEYLNIQVVDILLSTTIFSQNVVSDSAGHAKLQVCPVGILTDGSRYDVLVKGMSTLRKRFSAVLFAGSPTISVDLTGSGVRLLEGDTDLPVGNNVINYYDVAELSTNLYSTTNQRNDLNRDGKVNSLDLSNMITNLDKQGD